MEAKPVRHFFYLAVIANSPLDYFTPSPRSRRLEIVGTRKNGRARRRHPLLPSACYAGYFTPLMTRMRTLTGIEYKKITTAATMMIVMRIPMIIHL